MIVKHILKNIWQNTFRSVLIIISLTLSSMVLFLNLGLKDDMMAKYEALLKGAYRTYDVSVTSDPLIDNGLFDASALDLSDIDVEYALEELHAYGLMKTKDEGVQIVLRGIDRDLMIRTNLCVLQDSLDFDVNSDNQIIISQATSTAYSLHLGDDVPVTTEWGEEIFRVAAVAKDTGLYSAPGDNVFFMVSKTYLEQQSGHQGLSDRVYLDIREGSDVDAMTALLSGNNSGLEFSLLLDQASFASYTTRSNSILLVMLMLVVILNFYVVSSITKLLLTVRIPVVGTFRSVGATKNRVNGILILENAVYGLIGGITGVIFGQLTRGAVRSAFMESSYYGAQDVQTPIHVPTILGVIAFAVLLQIVITSHIVHKVGRMPIKDTIFHVQNYMQHISLRTSILGIGLLLLSVICHVLNTKYSLFPSVLAFGAATAGAVCLVPMLTRLLSIVYAYATQKLFGHAAALGAHDISYSKSITSSVVLVMVALSILLSMYILTLSSANVFATGYSQDSDIQIWGAVRANAEYDDLENIGGVDGIFYSYYAPVQLTSADHVYELGMIPLDKSGFGILDLDHLMPELKDNEILMDKYFAVRNDIRIGDEVIQNDKNLRFTVVGYIDSSAYTPSRNICVIRPSFFTAYESNVPQIIHISTGRDSGEMKEVLKTALAGENVYIQTTEEGIARSEESVSGILKMTWVMFGVAGLLAVVGLINNQMIGFLQRRSEFAVLYSVSMSKAQLQIMILFQVMGTFLIGTVLGTVLSLWLTKLLNDIMFAIGLCLPIHFDMRSVLLASSGVFLLLMLTVLSPMNHLAKMHVVDEIKRE